MICLSSMVKWKTVNGYATGDVIDALQGGNYLVRITDSERCVIVNEKSFIDESGAGMA